jgi:hypothetical protein
MQQSETNLTGLPWVSRLPAAWPDNDWHAAAYAGDSPRIRRWLLPLEKVPLKGFLVLERPMEWPARGSRLTQSVYGLVFHARVLGRIRMER